MYDAVQLFAKALDQLTKAQHITTTPLSCSKSRTWANGFSVLNYMKTVRTFYIHLSKIHSGCSRFIKSFLLSNIQGFLYTIHYTLPGQSIISNYLTSRVVSLNQCLHLHIHYNLAGQSFIRAIS